jgi:hypothetical protein
MPPRVILPVMSFRGNPSTAGAVGRGIVMTTIGLSYARPAIPFRKDNVPRIITGSQVIHDGFSVNAVLLGAPEISLATFQSQIADVIATNQAMRTQKGAGPAREVKVDLVWGTLVSYRHHVGQLCAGQPDMASVYIAASGFREAKVPTRNQVPLRAEATNLPGQVLLTIRSYLLETPRNRPYAKRTMLLRHTVDGGRTFVEDEATSTSQVVISGLPALVPIGFEVAAKDASGVSAWCPRVEITLTR